MNLGIAINAMRPLVKVKRVARQAHDERAIPCGGADDEVQMKTKV